MGAVGVGICELNGENTVIRRFYIGEESVLLFRVCGDIGNQLHLALPFAAAYAVRNGECEFSAFEGCLGIEAAAPVGRAEPGLLEVEAVQKFRTVSICSGSFRIFGLIGRKYGTVVNRMVLDCDTCY